MTIGNSSIIHPYSQSGTAYYGGHQNPLMDNNNMTNSIYSVHPQQNLSLLKNYFSANSGTLSSSASIHAMANNFGSRSTTHLSNNHQQSVMTPSSHNIMGSKGLPSPTPRSTPQDSSITTPVHQPYHYSQPELRHHNDSFDRSTHPDHNNHVKIELIFPSLIPSLIRSKCLFIY